MPHEEEQIVPASPTPDNTQIDPCCGGSCGCPVGEPGEPGPVGEVELTEQERAEAFVKHITTCDELGLYLAIEAIALVMGQVGRDVQEGTVDKKSIEELAMVAEMSNSLSNSLRMAKQQTARFGVSQEQEKFQEEYEQWFLWWNKYVVAIRDLNDGSWEQVQELIDGGVDTSAIRPAGDWKPDPNAYRDGAVPAAWLVMKLDWDTVTAQVRSKIIMKVGRSVGKSTAPFPTSSLGDSEKWQAFRGAAKTDDEVWSFKDPGSCAQGYALVSNRRAAAAFYVDQPNLAKDGF